jgi:hypothetical protein
VKHGLFGGLRTIAEPRQKTVHEKQMFRRLAGPRNGNAKRDNFLEVVILSQALSPYRAMSCADEFRHGAAPAFLRRFIENGIRQRLRRQKTFIFGRPFNCWPRSRTFRSHIVSIKASQAPHDECATVEGVRLNVRVPPGGADWQIIQSLRPSQAPEGSSSILRSPTSMMISSGNPVAARFGRGA